MYGILRKHVHDFGTVQSRKAVTCVCPIKRDILVPPLQQQRTKSLQHLIKYKQRSALPLKKSITLI